MGTGELSSGSAGRWGPLFGVRARPASSRAKTTTSSPSPPSRTPLPRCALSRERDRPPGHPTLGPEAVADALRHALVDFTDDDGAVRLPAGTALQSPTSDPGR